MSEPRDALIVLLRIIQEVPADQIEFREQLTHLGKNTLVYRAPEMRDKFSTWSELDVIMKRHIPDADPDNEEWKKNCIDIFVGTK